MECCAYSLSESDAVSVDPSDPVSDVSLARTGDWGPLSSVVVFLDAPACFPVAPAFEYFLL